MRLRRWISLTAAVALLYLWLWGKTVLRSDPAPVAANYAPFLVSMLLVLAVHLEWWWMARRNPPRQAIQLIALVLGAVVFVGVELIGYAYELIFGPEGQGWLGSLWPAIWHAWSLGAACTVIGLSSHARRGRRAGRGAEGG